MEQIGMYIFPFAILYIMMLLVLHLEMLAGVIREIFGSPHKQTGSKTGGVVSPQTRKQIQSSAPKIEVYPPAVYELAGISPEQFCRDSRGLADGSLQQMERKKAQRRVSYVKKSYEKFLEETF